MDALMRAVPTGDVAQVAADAGIAIDARHNLEVEIQVLPLGDFGQGQAAEIVDGAEAFLIHPVAQAVDHVFHDAVAVAHGGRADLHRAATEQHELGGFAPAGDAANSRPNSTRRRSPTSTD